MKHFFSLSRYVAVALALATLPMQAQSQDDLWGCTCILCLADPRGPTTEAACRPPIYALWRHLAKGKPFPPCRTVVGLSTNFRYASTQWCPESLKVPTVDVFGNKDFICNATGSIDVQASSGRSTRVWFGIGGGVEQTLIETVSGY